MLIRLTEELKALALEVARLYQPLREPLLVGSCVWLGEGKDIDVVVFVDDASAGRDGERCCPWAYGGMVAYRHGPVNVIARQLEAPLGTVKAWIKRSLAALRECMG